MRVFLKRLRNKQTQLEDITNPDYEEIRVAKNYWIRQVQKQLKDVSGKEIEKLTPFQDEEYITRISGRLKKFDNF